MRGHGPSLVVQHFNLPTAIEDISSPALQAPVAAPSRKARPLILAWGLQEEKLEKQAEFVHVEKELESWRKAEADRRQGQKQTMDKLKVRVPVACAALCIMTCMVASVFLGSVAASASMPRAMA